MAAASLQNHQQAGVPNPALALNVDLPELLSARAREPRLAYSGSVTPEEAWHLVEQQAAILLDVRTAEERKFVGYVPASLHLPWATGTAMQTNPRFIRELEAKVSKQTVLLLLCRSGQRSAAAATAAAMAGFQHVYNILEGFEGDLDPEQHRGTHEGWRYRGLPWVQD